jgi:hypothetical protein
MIYAQVRSDPRSVAMTKPTAQTGLSCCAVRTAHRLEFTGVEVEEILRLYARKAAASTPQACMRQAAGTP